MCFKVGKYEFVSMQHSALSTLTHNIAFHTCPSLCYKYKNPFFGCIRTLSASFLPPFFLRCPTPTRTASPSRQAPLPMVSLSLDGGTQPHRCGSTRRVREPIIFIYTFIHPLYTHLLPYLHLLSIYTRYACIFSHIYTPNTPLKHPLNTL